MNRTHSNTWWKIAAAVAAVLMLSAPSAVGVFWSLAPTRGFVAAGMAAAGFELAYLSLSLLVLRPELRRHARGVALASVTTAILLNALADYAHRVPGGLASWPQAVASFDPLALVLAIVESAPLAGLSFALASLLHRLAEEPSAPAEPVDDGAPQWRGSVLIAEPSLARQEAYPAPQQVTMPVQAVTTACSPDSPPKTAVQASTDACKAPHYACPGCGAPLTLGAYGAARRHGHCRQCRPGKGA